jgi:uncharacterized membrane-anchored protein YhcB (DUF1043 family)
MDWLKMCEQYGLLGVVTGAMITLLFLIVKWTLNTTKEILTQSKIDKEAWRETIDRIRTSIDEHDKRAEERGRYVREEHRQMIDTLARINGYKKD